MPSVTAELTALVRHDIPEGRQNLSHSHTNLQKVAEYCEATYFSADNKQAALEATKDYTTRSLASLGYQINTLAFNLLHMLDLQTAQLNELGFQVSHIAQMIDIHKEKVARREIGVLTCNKTTTRHHKIVAPAALEKAFKYVRKPIDYNVLDEIGHGCSSGKVPSSASQIPMHLSGAQTAPRARRTSSNSSQMIGAAGPAPTSKPPTPPQMARASVMGGTLNRGSRDFYRTPPAIAPPQVPSNYAANYPVGHPRRQSGYSTLPAQHSSSAVASQQHADDTNTLPSQPNKAVVFPSNVSEYMRSHGQQHGAIPDAHPMATAAMDAYGGAASDRSASPPLPPPPPGVHDDAMGGGALLARRNDGEPDWAPREYIEKVVAIYDYEADKSDELSFSENSVIYVLKKNSDGWLEGVFNGMTGLFPGNYVEPCM